MVLQDSKTEKSSFTWTSCWKSSLIRSASSVTESLYMEAFTFYNIAMSWRIGSRESAFCNRRSLSRRSLFRDVFVLHDSWKKKRKTTSTVDTVKPVRFDLWNLSACSLVVAFMLEKKRNKINVQSWLWGRLGIEYEYTMCSAHSRWIVVFLAPSTSGRGDTLLSAAVYSQESRDGCAECRARGEAWGETMRAQNLFEGSKAMKKIEWVSTTNENTR